LHEILVVGNTFFDKRTQRRYFMELRGSKTEKNLLAAFAGESMAANRYWLHSEVAKKEGYEQIKAIFEETTENEKQHAKRIFRFLEDCHTEENLKSAALGEHEEHTKIYPEMERVATEEGFTEIASFFKHVTEVEAAHEKRFLALLQLLEEKKVFEGTEQTVWICRNCGYIYVGKEPPVTCPVCKHPKAFFERKAENF